ncbi:MAG TPA: response regulator, partial [Luteitalea sp.]|nr:response regulator [Luteitalea sp.]
MARILVVEDEPHLAMGLRFNLEADGHAVDVAADGETALSALERADHGVDAVVLDVMLPGVDGFEVARALRGRGDFVPILMLTARGRSEDVLLG